MKYIKHFDNDIYHTDTYKRKKNFTNKYNINDYVLLNVELIEHNNRIWGHKDVVFDKYGIIIEIHENNDYPYIILFYNDEIFYLSEDEIERKLNQNEIEDFLTKKDSEKYNL